MATMYLLIGEEEYEDAYELGIFDSLELAIQGRKDYRAGIHAPNSLFTEHHQYVVYEFELNTLMAPTTAKAVDRFIPSKTRKRQR